MTKKKNQNKTNGYINSSPQTENQPLNTKQAAPPEKNARWQSEDPKNEKARWRESFAEDEIDLTKLPYKPLIIKARRILQAIREGQPYTELKGKRLNYDRKVISVPIDNDYRILFLDMTSMMKPLQVLSHEEYNCKKPGATKRHG